MGGATAANLGTSASSLSRYDMAFRYNATSSAGTRSVLRFTAPTSVLRLNLGYYLSVYADTEAPAPGGYPGRYAHAGVRVFGQITDATSDAVVDSWDFGAKVLRDEVVGPASESRSGMYERDLVVSEGGQYDIEFGTSGHTGVWGIGEAYALTAATGMSLSAVPEPTTMILLGSGLFGLAGFGRKRFKK